MKEAGELSGQERTVADIVAYWATQTPHAPALLEAERQPLTYRELDTAMTTLAVALRQHGLGPGDRIGLLLPASREATVMLLAAQSVAIAIPLNPLGSVDEIARAVTAEAAAIIATPATLSLAESAAAVHGARVITLTPALDAGVLRLYGAAPHHEKRPTTRVSPGDTSLIFSTSGTTGASARVPLSQRQLLATSARFGRVAGLGAVDCCLNLGLLHHVLHIANLLPMLQSGGSTVIVPGVQGATVLTALRIFPVSWGVAVPPVYRVMVEMAARESISLHAPALKFLASAGTPLPEDLARRIELAMGTPMLNLYGMSEAQNIALTPLPPGRRKPGAIGPSICEGLRIVDGGGHELPVGETGEIVTRGAHVFRGYLDDEAANAAAFLPGGWFRTGDVGYFDDDGYLFLTGRLKELINRGGEKFVPGEIDAALLAHQAVSEAAAFSIPDERLGEEVVAAVVLKPGMTASAREVRREVARHLSLGQIPRRIWFVDNLPRTASGKIKRGELSSRFGGGAMGDAAAEFLPARDSRPSQ